MMKLSLKTICNLNKILKFTVGSTPEQSSDLIFIRHAHSFFNEACQQYRRKKNIPFNWDVLCSDLGFQNEVAYNLQFMDCKITLQGYNEAKIVRQILLQEKIDLVLVSPQQRALETCQQIFKERDITTLVIPNLTGPLWSTCDISGKIQPKKQQFNKYDFSQVDQMGPLWFIRHLSDENQKKCQKHFRREQATTFQQQQQIILKLLSRKSIIQSLYELRQRVILLKQQLRKFKKKYSRIAVISHYYTIQYISSSKFLQSGQPETKVNISNCQPYKCDSAILLQNTEN